MAFYRCIGGSGSGGDNFKPLIENGWLSHNSQYADALFDAETDISEYDLIVFFIYKSGSLQKNALVFDPSTLADTWVSSTYRDNTDKQYNIRYSSKGLGITEYSGAWLEIYTDTYGIKLEA